MARLSYTLGRFIAWWVNGLDELLIECWPMYRARRYWQDWENFRIADDDAWNHNLLEILTALYGYDED